MRKATIISLILIMVFASTVYSYCAGVAYYLSINDEGIGSTTNPTSWPFIPIGKWANGETMYMRTNYDATNTLRGYYWTYDKGLFGIDTSRAEAYNTQELFLIQGAHPETTVTVAWKPDDLPLYRGTGGIYTYKSNNTWTSTSWDNYIGGQQYKDYKIISSLTKNVTGYGKAMGFGLSNGVSSFNSKKFLAIEGTYEDMCAYIDNLENEAVGGNGISGVVNPTFSVKAGYALILELDGANTLGISQTIDTNGYKASAPMWGKWRWGHYERFGNDLAFTFNFNSSDDIVWTKNGGTILNPAKTGYHVTDMGASTNYKYYMFANPPLPVAAEHNGNPGVPVTVRVNGTIKRAILYPLQENVWEQSYTYDQNRTDVITYVDNNGELEQREVTGVDITGENPNISATTEQVGNITTQKELNYNDDSLTGGLNELLNKNNDTSNTITENFTNFFNNIRSIFTWLPTEVYTTCVGMFSIILAIYVIKLFR